MNDQKIKYVNIDEDAKACRGCLVNVAVSGDLCRTCRAQDMEERESR